MGVQLKRVKEQVVVIDVRGAAEEIRAVGGQATHVVADVADPAALQRAADTATREFGGVDTWVNNAGVSIYGRIEEVPVADARRLFETNYWGVVHGSLAALPLLRRNGGALINVGSVLSETAMPLQGHYSASKHAVKGFTDSLRIELEEEDAGVSVTLIQPAAIDTPYPDHAKNYLGVQAKHQPPVYAPELVANAILTCAEEPHRNVRVGGSAKMFTVMEKVAPGIADRFKERTSFAGQLGDGPPPREDTLYAPHSGDASVRGRYPGRVRKTSAYTTAALNPMRTLVGAATLGVGIAVALGARRR
jgi:NAD(P)-dependent dehydrogenase (short-subunit alcohol dehydrogenase family)